MALTAASLDGYVSPTWDTTARDTALGLYSTEADETKRLRLAALYLLRRERSELVNGPLKFTAAGDYSEDLTSKLTYLDARIAELEALTATGAAGEGVTTGLATIGQGRMRRTDRPGLFGVRQ